MGVKQPPTISDMKAEIEKLSHSIDVDTNSFVELYTNRKPEVKKKSLNIWIFIGIPVAFLILLIISLCCYFATSQTKKTNFDSDTSIESKMS